MRDARINVCLITNTDKRKKHLDFHKCNKKYYQKYKLIFDVVENRTISGRKINTIHVFSFWWFILISYFCRQKQDIKEIGAFSISIQRFSLCNFDDSAKEGALCFKMIYL